MAVDGKTAERLLGVGLEMPGKPDAGNL